MFLVILSFVAAVYLAPENPKQSEAATVPTSNFPKLAALWIDTSTPEKIAAAAKFDWVGLLYTGTKDIPTLKAINPNLVTLGGYIGAREFAAASLANSQIPPNWIVTQVGTTLSTNIDATTQSIPLLEMSKNGIDLFVVGQYVLIGNELGTITAVNKSNSTLTVTRGTAYTPTSHPAGDKVAAAISTYPGTISMDMTDYCPLGMASGSPAQERWRDWNSRRALSKAPSSYDGLFVDIVDPTILNYLSETGNNRSIDYNRNNTFPNDNYAAYDAAFYAGMHDFNQQVVNGLNGRYYFTNGSMPDYSLHNGTGFEGFPNFYQYDWQTTMFGPRNPSRGTLIGSIKDWMTYSATPNLSTLYTYPNDPVGTSAYYQDMRYGLTSALIMGMYYAYDPSGSGSKPFPWYDEFDNAGTGDGYLGKTVSDYYPAKPMGTTDLLSGNGNLDSSTQFAQWDFSKPTTGTNSTAAATLDTSVKVSGTSSAKIVVPNAGSQGQVKLTYGAHTTLAPAVAADSDYTYTITAKASGDMDLWTCFDTYTDYFPHWIHLTPEWQTFSFSTHTTAPRSLFKFVLGQKAGTIWIDSVTLTTGTKKVMRRDFENGIAIVNANSVPVTVPLETTYKKINGTQDRTVNDGSTVTSATIQPKDGIILLRTSALTKPGDANLDGVVNISDLSILMANWGSSPTNLNADFNKDGSVNISDLSILMANWGS
jgi:hypothetical protein